MKLVTGAQMRDLDKLVIENYAMPSIVLMENAAIQIAAEINRHYGPIEGRPIAVVCGKGNNGGDGIAVARHLAVRYKAKPLIWLVESMDTATPDTLTNLTIARSYGIQIETISDPLEFRNYLTNSEIVVDAILGTGVVGDPRPAAAAAIQAINDSGRTVVSIDIPSGLDDTGFASNPTIQASSTITLALPKLSLFLYPGATLAGDVITVDISFPNSVTNAGEASIVALQKADIAELLPSRTAGRDSNKGKFGSVAILAGSPGYLGAACLAAEGAARGGAGLVTLGVPQSIFDSMMSRVIESVMTQPFACSSSGKFDTSSIDDVLLFCKKRDGVAFGPGVGVGADASGNFLRRLIAECDKPMVIDADALTLLAQEPDRGASIVRSRKAPTVLTPHPGEMGRLLGADTASVQNDRLSAVREAAAQFGAVVVLKGQASLIADPDGNLAVNTTGNPGMATGGSGDVLTGLTATLLAQIENPWNAASAAVFLHGLAGDIAAAEIGLGGILASDIAGKIPAAITSCYNSH